MSLLTAEEQARIVDHAQQQWPDEACGVIIEVSGGVREVVECRNIQDGLHSHDPKRWPQDARQEFTLDPRDLVRAVRRGRIVVIYHSHPGGRLGASAPDRAKIRAEAEAGPALRDALHVIVTLAGVSAPVRERGHTVRGWRAYRWSRQDSLVIEESIAPRATPDPSPTKSVDSEASDSVA